MEEKNSARDENRQLWVLMNQTRHVMARYIDSALRDTGVTEVQVSLLYYLMNVDSTPNQAEVSRWLYRKPHTVFSLVNSMAKLGMVKKVKDKKRRNVTRVMITDKGREMYMRAQEQYTEALEIMSTLSQGEKGQLEGSLRKLREAAFEKLPQEQPPASFV
ncbi:MAG: MarR family winged helix-turn-helix transcriptional regulator [Dehalococcoidia bacterium]